MVKQEEIGALIKARRMKERVSLEDLAALTGVGINTLSRLERGVGNTRLNVLLTVTNALGLRLTVTPFKTLS
ncbi:MAG: helix-turn-helix domain-containing protein [Akkermansiaceae bacterium]|nr:helix-turn-helix domain-containing protein [Akkermansiaceae bacterium]